MMSRRSSRVSAPGLVVTVLRGCNRGNRGCGGALAAHVSGCDKQAGPNMPRKRNVEGFAGVAVGAEKVEAIRLPVLLVEPPSTLDGNKADHLFRRSGKEIGTQERMAIVDGGTGDGRRGLVPQSRLDHADGPAERQAKDISGQHGTLFRCSRHREIAARME